MTELEKIMRAKTYIEKLANGIDPITDSELPEDAVLNNVRLARCFFYVADILQQVTDNGGITSAAKKKKQFEITEQQKRHIPMSYTPISISVICENISSVVDLTIYKTLSFNKVTGWLVEKGFLQEIIEEDKKRKTLTDKSSLIGMTQEEKLSQNGTQYTVNLYNLEAQQFIIDHLNEILT